ncbi:putative duf300 domain protein [Neofusicoccum parvum UCRNP2]|nr:putative duf300 domain protein [Neofusicoccum parvum UCRNP2]
MWVAVLPAATPPVLLDIRFDSTQNAALFRIRVPVGVKGLRNKVNLYLFIYPDTILSLESAAGSDDVPEPVRSVFAKKPFGTTGDIVALRFVLERPASLVGPENVELAPTTRAFGCALDSLRSLATAIELTLFVASEDLSRAAVNALCAQAGRDGGLRLLAGKDSSLEMLYGGNSGKVIEIVEATLVRLEEAEAKFECNNGVVYHDELDERVEDVVSEVNHIVEYFTHSRKLEFLGSRDVGEIREVPLPGLPINFHTLAQNISFVFSAVAIFISFFLISRHAANYSRPDEQKQIIRILLMVPIYAAVSMLSIHYYTKHVYFEVMRDCYEAFAISSFFTLLCNYITPELHDQKEFFRTITPHNWVWPVNWCQKCTGGESKGWLRKPQSGLTWFNIIYIAVFQYCFIRVFFTVVSVITEHYDVLCEDSLSPVYAYLWVLIFESVAVTLAMYCLIQFYTQLKNDLAHHRPFLKLLSIKLVIFFCFWQDELLSILNTEDVITESKFLAYGDIEVALPNILICIEMAFFATLHLFAFPWKEYVVTKAEGPEGMYRVGTFKALAHALNPSDVVKAFARGCRWLFVGSRKRHLDRSYQPTQS